MEFAIFPLREHYVAVWFFISAAALLLLRFRLKASRTAVLNTMLALWSAALLTGIVLTGATTDDYTLYIPDAGNATLIGVTSGTGSRSLVLGCGGDYQAFSDLKDHLQSRTAFAPDVVVIPRDSSPENNNLKNLLRYLPPEHLILPTGAQLTQAVPDDVRRADSFDAALFDGLRVAYETEPDFCAGTMEINGKKLVFCLYPASDFTGRDERYRAGDLLICRGAIPPTLDADRFGSVVVLTDRSAADLNLPPNAVATADEGGYTTVFRRGAGKKDPGQRFPGQEERICR